MGTVVGYSAIKPTKTQPLISQVCPISNCRICWKTAIELDIQISSPLRELKLSPAQPVFQLQGTQTSWPYSGICWETVFMWRNYRELKDSELQWIFSGEENSCSPRTSPFPGRPNLSCVPSCPLDDQTTPTSAGEDLLPPAGEVYGQGCAGPRHQVLTAVTQNCWKATCGSRVTIQLLLS